MFWRNNKGPAVSEVASAAAPSEEASTEDKTKPQEQVVVDVSAIDFGEKVDSGSRMIKGFCANGGPDEIQACIWKVDTADGKTKGGNSKIHIEF
eukprot:scaffold405163_cov45-Prasinocladus_malaysianus.AAC.1